MKSLQEKPCSAPNPHSFQIRVYRFQHVGFQFLWSHNFPSWSLNSVLHQRRIRLDLQQQKRGNLWKGDLDLNTEENQSSRKKYRNWCPIKESECSSMSRLNDNCYFQELMEGHLLRRQNQQVGQD